MAAWSWHGAWFDGMCRTRIRVRVRIRIGLNAKAVLAIMDWIRRNPETDTKVEDTIACLQTVGRSVGRSG